MNVDVSFLPQFLTKLDGTAVAVVFDVLRATTTMVSALAEGVRAIQIYSSTSAARQAAAQQENMLLCGEEQCRRPEGFDLGNSPGAFKSARHADRTVCMSTTNGTRAILGAAGAGHILVGALVNASAVAVRAMERGDDVVLWCAGTNGAVAAEDVLGAGAVLQAMKLLGPVTFRSDAARIAEDLFAVHRSDLSAALRASRGGQNVIAAGLGEDIEFAARLDAFNVVGEVQWDGDTPVVSVLKSAPP